MNLDDNDSVFVVGLQDRTEDQAMLDVSRFFVTLLPLPTDGVSRQVTLESTDDAGARYGSVTAVMSPPDYRAGPFTALAGYAVEQDPGDVAPLPFEFVYPPSDGGPAIIPNPPVSPQPGDGGILVVVVGGSIGLAATQPSNIDLGVSVRPLRIEDITSETVPGTPFVPLPFGDAGAIINPASVCTFASPVPFEVEGFGSVIWASADETLFSVTDVHANPTSGFSTSISSGSTFLQASPTGAFSTASTARLPIAVTLPRSVYVRPYILEQNDGGAQAITSDEIDSDLATASAYWAQGCITFVRVDAGVNAGLVYGQDVLYIENTTALTMSSDLSFAAPWLPAGTTEALSAAVVDFDTRAVRQAPPLPTTQYMELYYRQKFPKTPGTFAAALKVVLDAGVGECYGIIVSCTPNQAVDAGPCSPELRGNAVAHEIGHCMGLGGELSFPGSDVINPPYVGPHAVNGESLMQRYGFGADISGQEAAHATRTTSE